MYIVTGWVRQTWQITCRKKCQAKPEASVIMYQKTTKIISDFSWVSDIMDIKPFFFCFYNSVFFHQSRGYFSALKVIQNHNDFLPKGWTSHFKKHKMSSIHLKIINIHLSAHSFETGVCPTLCECIWITRYPNV